MTASVPAPPGPGGFELDPGLWVSMGVAPVNLNPRQAILGPVLDSRGVCLGLGWAGVGQLVLTGVGWPGWTCPVLQVTGLPCPGCGLTQAVLELLTGRFGEAIVRHAFAPFVLVGVALVVVAGWLPDSHRRSLARLIGRWERASGLTGWGLIALLGYWLARLMVPAGAP